MAETFHTPQISSFEEDQVGRILRALHDKKAIHPILLDVRNWCPIADYTVVATGSVDRHVQALAEAVTNALGEEVPYQVDGLWNGDWVLIDTGSVLVHLMTPAMREFYAIEQLWPQATILHHTPELALPLSS